MTTVPWRLDDIIIFVQAPATLPLMLDNEKPANVMIFNYGLNDLPEKAKSIA